MHKQIILGKPLPPTDLIVYLEDSVIYLQWCPPFTLFSKQVSIIRETPMPQYVVYAYSNHFDINICYRRETNSTLTNYMILLNDRFQLCNLSIMSITLSVRVGEGEMSNREVISHVKPIANKESLCQKGRDQLFATSMYTVNAMTTGVSDNKQGDEHDLVLGLEYWIRCMYNILFLHACSWNTVIVTCTVQKVSM